MQKNNISEIMEDYITNIINDEEIEDNEVEKGSKNNNKEKDMINDDLKNFLNNSSKPKINTPLFEKTMFEDLDKIKNKIEIALDTFRENAKKNYEDLEKICKNYTEPYIIEKSQYKDTIKINNIAKNDLIEEMLIYTINSIRRNNVICSK